MKKDPLTYLTKEELIQIIKTSPTLKRQAHIKVCESVYNKINSIIDKQEKCDLATSEGVARYAELEAEYKKWTKIQERL